LTFKQNSQLGKKSKIKFGRSNLSTTAFESEDNIFLSQQISININDSLFSAGRTETMKHPPVEIF
jgi:hypothetical protein